LFSLSIILLLISVCYSQYVLIPLTDNSYNDTLPQINNNGYVVWVGYDRAKTEIFLYNNKSIKQISYDALSNSNSGPKINNNGHVVWYGADGSGWKIFFYDGTNVTNISNTSNYNFNPQINDNDYVVWEEGSISKMISLYDGTSTIQLTSAFSDNRNPRINNNGYVVWQGWGQKSQIYLYDGSSTTNISDNDYDNHDPQINDNGYVVWSGFDGSDDEIFLYDGTSTTQITYNSYNDLSPQINNNGYVVWQGSDGHDTEIFLYDGTNTTNISNNDYYDYDPQISNNGYVVWIGWDGTDEEIFLYNGTTTIQLTNNTYNDAYPEINDNGWAVFGVWDHDYEIFIARPATTGSSDIWVIPASNDFGSVKIGSLSSPQTFTISNAGTAGLVIDNIGITRDDIEVCQAIGCPVIDPASFILQNDTCSGSTLASSDTCTVQVIFRPTSEGPKVAALTIPSNDPDTPILNKPLSGTGIISSSSPSISVSPRIHRFDSIYVGTSSVPKTSTITNTGTADLHISDMALSDISNYSLDVNGGTNPCGSTTSTIAPDDSCTVTVTFSPTTAGQKPAKLSINSDAPDTPILDVPLTGNGITPSAEIKLLLPDGGDVIPSGGILWYMLESTT
jgi:hypothetical protein